MNEAIMIMNLDALITSIDDALAIEYFKKLLVDLAEVIEPRARRAPSNYFASLKEITQ